MRNDCPRKGIGRNTKRFFTTAEPLQLRLCSFHNQYIIAPPIFPWNSTMVNDSRQPTTQPVTQTVVIKEKQGWSLGTRILLWLIAIVVIVSVIAVLTLTVAVLETPTGTSFPYTTTYRVSIPDSETVMFGNSKILVLTMGNEVDTSVDGVKERLAIGQERTISPR